MNPSTKKCVSVALISAVATGIAGYGWCLFVIELLADYIIEIYYEATGNYIDDFILLICGIITLALVDLIYFTAEYLAIKFAGFQRKSFFKWFVSVPFVFMMLLNFISKMSLLFDLGFILDGYFFWPTLCTLIAYAMIGLSYFSRFLFKKIFIDIKEKTDIPN
ncbi:MAG: hypothetical protein Q4F95_10635 [Oscillospiraceae bacterium]|nr:hypothetical protein [Oscillospiraceae bacterium]